MATNHLTTTVASLRAGDRFIHEGSGWVALSDAEPVDGVWRVRVQYHPDGGVGTREWTDGSYQLPVARDEQ